LVGFSEWSLDGLVGGGKAPKAFLAAPKSSVERAGPESLVTGAYQTFPEYHPAPIDLVPGTHFDLKRVILKIADFGFGSPRYSTLT